MSTPRGRDARWTSRSPARSKGVQINKAECSIHVPVVASLSHVQCSLSQAAVALAAFSFFELPDGNSGFSRKDSTDRAKHALHKAT